MSFAASASERPGSSVKRIVKKENSSSSLIVLKEPGKENLRSSTSAVDGGKTKAQGINERPAPPSKVVPLQLSKKEKSSNSFGKFDWEEHNRLESTKFEQLTARSNLSKEDSVELRGGSEDPSLSTGNMTEQEETISQSVGSGKTTCTPVGDIDMPILKPPSDVFKKAPNIDTAETASDEFDTDLEEVADGSDKSSSESEDAPLKAPTDLLMEFLQAVMLKKWELAQKLCTMILIYEPNHPEALMYKDVIEERMQFDLEKTQGSETSSSDDDDDEGENNDENASDQSESGSDETD